MVSFVRAGEARLESLNRSLPSPLHQIALIPKKDQPLFVIDSCVVFIRVCKGHVHLYYFLIIAFQDAAITIDSDLGLMSD
jgi:hypothetical protein